MKNFKIINIGKVLFWLSFLLANICLFGYIFTKEEQFVISGYLLLIFGGIINLVAVLALLIYALCAPKNSREALLAVLYITINIPVAVLYAYIGIEILN